MSDLTNIKFVQALFDISWVLMDFVRDRRYSFSPDKPVKPRKDIPDEVLQAIVNLNSLTSHVLVGYNKPEENFEGEIPETIIDTVELSKEGNTSSST